MLAHKVTRTSKARNGKKSPASAILGAPLSFALDDEQLKVLGADVIALKLLLPALLSRIGRLDPILGSAIQQGFQDATDQAEHLIAWTEARDPCTSALASIKRLHAAVLTDLRQADSQA
jgi:hypothetical protein